MTCRRLSPRWAAWAFALALLLKAAVPLLAAGSAHAQGKALAEVCTVYGVATVALDGQPSAPTSGHDAVSHAGDHCALSGLASLGIPPAQLALVPTPAPIGSAAPALAGVCAPDACAAWAARLEHGPPRRA
jgi:hypothetical protein